jgi:3-oxoacyl-[acyl-carrier protein] reductase
MSMQIDLTGKVAVVTGGSGELGRAIVRALSDCGASVAINYLKSREKAESLAAEIKSAGRRAVTVQADVTIEADVMRLRDEVSSALGPANIIVNNAVMQYSWTSVLDQSPADYEGQFRSSVLHNVLMAKAFVPDMIEKRWGRVIAINSECAMQNFAGQSAYVSGKRGMDGVLRSLAREIGQHQITVNQVAPGWMISDKYRGGGEHNEVYENNVPLHGRGEDKDIANTVAFLASDLANFVTGVYLPVCGGNVMPAI